MDHSQEYDISERDYWRRELSREAHEEVGETRAGRDNGPPVTPTCDGGAQGGFFPTACGRDYVHPAHPLGQPPVVTRA